MVHSHLLSVGEEEQPLDLEKLVDGLAGDVHPGQVKYYKVRLLCHLPHSVVYCKAGQTHLEY